MNHCRRCGKNATCQKKPGRNFGLCGTCRLKKNNGSTVIVYPDSCLEHETKLGRDTHQECPERLLVTCGPNGILRLDKFDKLSWLESDHYDFKKIDLANVLRVHHPDYLSHLQQQCEKEVY